MPLPSIPAVALKCSPTGRASAIRVIINAQIDPELRDRVARAAVEQGRSFASVVREALEKFVAEYEKKAVRR